MKLMLMTSLMTSTLLTSANHPVLILTLILAQTILYCVMIWFYMKTAWMSFTLFLIFLGGLMVLFVYAVSLTPNEKFNLSMKMINKLISYPAMAFTLIVLSNMYLNQPNNYTIMINQISLMFSQPSLMIITIIISYLLITLIVIVEIANKKEGPLRNMIK